MHTCICIHTYIHTCFHAYTQVCLSAFLDAYIHNTLEHISFREYDKRERRSAWYSRCIGMPLYVPHTQTHTQTHTERHRDTTQNAQEKHAHACLSLALERELQQGA